MKIRVVSSKDEIETLKPAEAEIAHLAFRPSNKDIFSLTQLCPNIKAIQIPGSYKKTLSESIQMFLTMQNIVLLEGDVWGHRKDINEYAEIPEQDIQSIKQLKADNVPDDEIISLMAWEKNMNADLIRYIIRF